MTRLKIKRITVPWVHFIAYRLAIELMEYDEPIPDFKTRSPNILESCVETPFQTYNKKPLYKGLLGKASALFYLMIKNHPFQNGNKRIAITTLLIFLYEHDRLLFRVPNITLYKFAIYVAKSRSTDKDIVIQNINSFLKKRVRTIKIL